MVPMKSLRSGMNKKCAFLLLLCFSAINAVGQAGLERLISAYEKFQTAGTHPNMQLILNQTRFSPGDTVFYKAYLLDQYHQPVAGENLFRIYVTDFRRKIVAEEIFEVVDGRGFNKIPLPESLAAGLYLVTVESPWLRNAVPSAVYHQEIAVVREREISRQEIKAFAEGGNLIPSFPNKVVFRGPRNAAIQIENSRGDVVDTCFTDDFGLGHVILNPADAQSYFAEVRQQDLRVEIPCAQGKCGLRLHRSLTDNMILVDWKCVDEVDNGGIFAIVTGQGSLRYSGTVESDKNDKVLRIPTDKLSAGVNTLLLLDQEGRVLAFRNFYHHPSAAPQVEIMPVQSIYQSRQEVHLDIAVKNEFGDPIEGEFAFWVVNGNVLNPLDAIRSVTGLAIPVPAIARGSFSETRDDYWITQRVNSDWEAVLRTNWPSSDSHRSVLYRTGTVYINESGQPAPDNTQVSFYFLNTGLHYQTFTLNGRIQITMPEFRGDENLFYMAEDPDGGLAYSVKIEWDTETMEPAPSAPSIELTEKDRYGQFASKLRSIHESYRYFFESGIGKATNVATGSVFKFEEKVAGADIEVDLDEYQSFKTLPELINEIIPSLKFRIRRDKPTIRVDLKAAAVAKQDPLFIIDGFPTHNTELFLALQPAEIESISIIRSELKLRKLGLMGKNGVVLVKTNKTSHHRQLNENLEVIKGISPVFSFHDPDGGIRGNPKFPIFKSTVFWMPSVKTDLQGNASVAFYTTDDTGPLYIFVVGITKGGRSFFASKEILVNDGD